MFLRIEREMARLLLGQPDDSYLVLNRMGGRQRQFLVGAGTWRAQDRCLREKMGCDLPGIEGVVLRESKPLWWWKCVPLFVREEPEVDARDSAMREQSRLERFCVRHRDLLRCCTVVGCSGERRPGGKRGFYTLRDPPAAQKLR